MILTVGTGAARLVGMMTKGAALFPSEDTARAALRFLCTHEDDLDDFDPLAASPFDSLDYIIFCINDGHDPNVDLTSVLQWWVTAVMSVC